MQAARQPQRGQDMSDAAGLSIPDLHPSLDKNKTTTDTTAAQQASAASTSTSGSQPAALQSASSSDPLQHNNTTDAVSEETTRHALEMLASTDHLNMHDDVFVRDVGQRDANHARYVASLHPFDLLRSIPTPPDELDDSAGIEACVRYEWPIHRKRDFLSVVLLLISKADRDKIERQMLVLDEFQRKAKDAGRPSSEHYSAEVQALVDGMAEWTLSTSSEELTKKSPAPRKLAPEKLTGRRLAARPTEPSHPTRRHVADERDQYLTQHYATRTRARHTPSLRPFNVLAADEVHSIMHFCDRPSLLRLARCCRRLHGDADNNRAWKHLPMMHLAYSRFKSRMLNVEKLKVKSLIHRSFACKGVHFTYGFDDMLTEKSLAQTTQLVGGVNSLTLCAESFTAWSHSNFVDFATDKIRTLAFQSGPRLYFWTDDEIAIYGPMQSYYLPSSNVLKKFTHLRRMIVAGSLLIFAESVLCRLDFPPTLLSLEFGIGAATHGMRDFMFAVNRCPSLTSLTMHVESWIGPFNHLSARRWNESPPSSYNFMGYIGVLRGASTKALLECSDSFLR